MCKVKAFGQFFGESMNSVLGGFELFLCFTSAVSLNDFQTSSYAVNAVSENLDGKLDREVAKEVVRLIQEAKPLSPLQAATIPLMLEDLSLLIESKWSTLSIQKRQSLFALAENLGFKWRIQAEAKSRRLKDAGIHDPKRRVNLLAAFSLYGSILRASLVLKKNIFKDIFLKTRLVSDVITCLFDQDEELLKHYLDDVSPSEPWLEYNLAAKSSLERGLQQASMSEGRFIGSFAELANLNVDD
jgi:hypothetical protein